MQQSIKSLSLRYKQLASKAKFSKSPLNSTLKKTPQPNRTIQPLQPTSNPTTQQFNPLLALTKEDRPGPTQEGPAENRKSYSPIENDLEDPEEHAHCRTPLLGVCLGAGARTDRHALDSWLVSIPHCPQPTIHCEQRSILHHSDPSRHPSACGQQLESRPWLLRLRLSMLW